MPARSMALLWLLLSATLVASASVAEDISALYKRLSASVVTVIPKSAAGEIMGQGSGVVIGDGKTILTNFHVVNGATAIEVQTAQESLDASLAKCAGEVDLATVTVERMKPLQPVEISDQIPEVGAEVLAIGSPMGLSNTLSTGIVSQIRDVDAGPWIQTTAPISPGSSGGGLFSRTGTLIGITTLKMIGGEQLNFAVPIKEISRLGLCESVPVRTAQTYCPQLAIGGVLVAVGDSKEVLTAAFEGQAVSLVWGKEPGKDIDVCIISDASQALILGMLFFDRGTLWAANKQWDCNTSQEMNEIFQLLLSKVPAAIQDQMTSTEYGPTSYEGLISSGVDYEFSTRYRISKGWMEQNGRIESFVLSESIGEKKKKQDETE